LLQNNISENESIKIKELVISTATCRRLSRTLSVVDRCPSVLEEFLP